MNPPRNDAQAVPDNASWRAVVERDRRADGQFVYVALTTNIYCRPSCPARLPDRRSVGLVPSAAEAERRGFSACRRCHPGSLTPAETSVIAVLAHIEASFQDATTLGTLSRICGVSPNHLQEMFTRIVGLSPKAVLDHRRFARFKELLRNGEPIASARQAAGYRSSRAIYERAGRTLGMTPATYCRGGADVCIHFALAAVTPGVLLVARTDRGICAVDVGEAESDLVREVAREFPRSRLVRDKAIHPARIEAVNACGPEDPLLAQLSMKVRRDVRHARLWKAVGRSPGKSRGSLSANPTVTTSGVE